MALILLMFSSGGSMKKSFLAGLSLIVVLTAAPLLGENPPSYKIQRIQPSLKPASSLPFSKYGAQAPWLKKVVAPELVIRPYRVILGAFAAPDAASTARVSQRIFEATDSAIAFLRSTALPLFESRFGCAMGSGEQLFEDFFQSWMIALPVKFADSADRPGGVAYVILACSSVPDLPDATRADPSAYTASEAFLARCRDTDCNTFWDYRETEDVSNLYTVHLGP
jgi:hypothetical protein